MKHTSAALTAGIYGIAIGDALGQSTQFKSYEKLQQNPVHEMLMGAYQTLPGTWSDDTSMTLATLAAIAANATDATIPLEPVMNNFMAWLNDADFTPVHETFDVGNGTRQALRHYSETHNPRDAGSADVKNNGNGALMRMLPVTLWAIHQLDEGQTLINRPDLVDQIIEVAELTHRHARSTVACLLYSALLTRLIESTGWTSQFLTQAVQDVQRIVQNRTELAGELPQYNRLLDPAFYKLTAAQLNTSGYVVDTTESVWWLLNHFTDYHDLVLNAINLGGDTDTIASIAGGLAAIRGGLTSLPRDWQDQLLGRNVIANTIHDALRSGKY
ncbi:MULTISPECIES: ADP-ribosylglycohydrolase family protein [Furfurilactobacillus]|nr:ADP-ribosylglycohydrolase family protein [Furfurilactobacillus milii]